MKYAFEKHQPYSNIFDIIEDYNYLTEYDYEYLRGNATFWNVRGAALNNVYEWCRNKGYGLWGEPTANGIAAMRQYEASKSIPEQEILNDELPPVHGGIYSDV